MYRTQLLDCSVGDVDLIVKEVKYLWCSPRGLLVVLTTATWVPAFTLFLLSCNTRQNADKLVPFSNDAAAVTDHYSTQPVLPLPSNCRALSVSCCCGFQNVHQNGGYGCWYLTPGSYQEERRVNKIKSEYPIHCLVFTFLFFFCVQHCSATGGQSRGVDRGCGRQKVLRVVALQLVLRHCSIGHLPPSCFSERGQNCKRCSGDCGPVWHGQTVVSVCVCVCARAHACLYTSVSEVCVCMCVCVCVCARARASVRA